MKSEPNSGGAQRRRLRITLRQLLGSSIMLVTVLISGYALIPVIGLLPRITIPLFGLQLGAILFLIIGALFVYSLIGFVRAVFNFLQLHPSVILQHIPWLATEHPRTAARLFLNVIMIAIILVVYWIFSPILYLIPTVGEHIALGIQLVIAAVVAIFFWSVGVMIYRGLDKRLSMRIEEHQGLRGLKLLRMRALKVLLYLLITFIVIIIAYALFPAVSLGAYILIPGTGLAMGTVYWIIALAAIALSVFSLIRNLVGLFGLGPEMLSKAFPAMNIQQMSLMRRVFLNLIIVTAILMSFFIISPYITLIPNIGNYLGVAGQVVVGAIVVLFFWDIGRSLYVELERVFRRLEENRT